ncbi:hypothetical protein NESM_000904200 [Novymonas esmeraldas]|uniref:Uncharacterized protein n=1 Tax=Novymonas esmeraldas TaxID=1808958 RepID=A0AAW0EZE7_9TRYP
MEGEGGVESAAAEGLKVLAIQYLSELRPLTALESDVGGDGTQSRAPRAARRRLVGWDTVLHGDRSRSRDVPVGGGGGGFYEKAKWRGQLPDPPAEAETGDERLAIERANTGLHQHGLVPCRPERLGHGATDSPPRAAQEVFAPLRCSRPEDR